jgi:transposase
VRNIRRATRKRHSAEEKIRIVLDGLRGESSIAELCRREGIAESLYYARVRAEAGFRKEERAKEGAKAMMEYQANSRMVREKTERLKALRLAKEAADKNRAG